MNIEVASIIHEYDFIAEFYDKSDLDGCFPDIPISYEELVECVSLGLMGDGRVFWWPLLPRTLPETSIVTAPNIKDIASRRFQAAKTRMLISDIPECSSWETIQKARAFELSLLVCDMYDIVEPILVKQFIEIVVLLIPSSDICFQLCCDVLARGGSFLSFNVGEHDLKIWVFRELVKIHFPSEYCEDLHRINALSDKFLNLIFVEFFVKLLPPSHVLRIMDMFLLEGSIVLHRFGLGLIQRNFALLETAGSAPELWGEIAKASRDIEFSELMESAIDVGKWGGVFRMFSSGFEIQPDSLAETEEKIRIKLKEGCPEMSSRRRALSASVSTSQDPFLKSMTSSSKLLDRPAIQALRMFLGVYSADNFSLCFSTYQNGWSLDALYALTSHRSPCIIILRSLEHKALLGAFLPVPISPPSQRIRGDGRTFIFRLDGQHAKCFKWRYHAHLDDSEASEMTSGSALTHQQFAVCSIHYIIFGGSSKEGTNALRIDEDLKTCFCGPSDTFDNEPLLMEEPLQPFIVDEIEVFCGI